MTHDELLDKIYWHWRKDPRGDGLQTISDYRRVILAVVDLHRPSPIPDWVPTEEEFMCWCAHIYPCPTIKAIEKELI
jgi:hypothetical protein